MLQFARSLSRDVRELHDYLEGDTTIALRKEH
jgi:hypothetical protein